MGLTKIHVFNMWAMWVKCTVANCRTAILKMCVRSQFFIHIDSEYLRLTTDLALKFLFDHSFVCVLSLMFMCALMA